MLWLESEVPLEFFERRRGAERLHAEDQARVTGVSLPSEGRRLFYSDACLYAGRQHAVPVILCLVFEDLPGRHRDYPRTDAFDQQFLMRIYSETDFTTCSDKDYFRIS